MNYKHTITLCSRWSPMITPGNFKNRIQVYINSKCKKHFKTKEQIYGDICYNCYKDPAQLNNYKGSIKTLIKSSHIGMVK